MVHPTGNNNLLFRLEESSRALGRNASLAGEDLAASTEQGNQRAHGMVPLGSCSKMHLAPTPVPAADLSQNPSCVELGGGPGLIELNPQCAKEWRRTGIHGPDP